jgi:quercetin dioxygenase-like cupin family protein
MNHFKLDSFLNGWIVGNFTPSLHQTADFEVAVKFFDEGQIEVAHKQLIATEITIVVEGRIRLGSNEYSQGDIIEIPPHEVADFESLTKSSLVCIKFPSLPNDKVVVK